MMMRIIFLFVGMVVGGIFLSQPVMGEKTASPGEKIFTELGCVECHHPEVKINGPALKTIAATYGDIKRLLAYFKGDTGPIVEPERARTMMPRRRKIKKLSEDRQQALAEYIISSR